MMFVILVYDVQSNRVGKMRKISKKYLTPVQESVFEGHLTESRLKSLKWEIQQLIDPETDSVILYRSSGFGHPKKEQIGCVQGNTGFIL
jgi:CRISPR-associated protein Cas2